MNALIRKSHRWISMVFSVGFLVNLVAWTTAKPPVWLGLFVLVPLTFLLVTGLYLFILPHALRLRGRRAATQAKVA